MKSVVTVQQPQEANTRFVLPGIELEVELYVPAFLLAPFLRVFNFWGLCLHNVSGNVPFFPPHPPHLDSPQRPIWPLIGHFLHGK